MQININPHNKFSTCD